MLLAMGSISTNCPIATEELGYIKINIERVQLVQIVQLQLNLPYTQYNCLDVTRYEFLVYSKQDAGISSPLLRLHIENPIEWFSGVD